MKIVKAKFEILTPINSDYILTSLESAGRTCYNSEKEITPDSAKKFVVMLIKKGHESVLEHQSISVKITCDRGVSHEAVRHRIASFSQESQRYCSYSDDVYYIDPFFFEFESDVYSIWYDAMKNAEDSYHKLLKAGCTPEQARTVLPNSTKTEFVLTMNLREWRHFFKLRAQGLYGRPHPQMLEITIPMLAEFKTKIPTVFDDIGNIDG